MEARKGGGGSSATGWCSAATMAVAAAFQDAGRGVGVWLGAEWRGEEREHRVAKQNGERDLGRRGRRRREPRRVRGVAVTCSPSCLNGGSGRSEEGWGRRWQQRDDGEAMMAG